MTMIEPPIAELLDKVDSRYTLVILTAKRARQLTAGSVRRVKIDTNKNVTVAVHEIAEGKVTYERLASGIK
jgi:DNA-directed RNA polymerase subunit omega